MLHASICCIVRSSRERAIEGLDFPMLKTWSLVCIHDRMKSALTILTFSVHTARELYGCGGDRDVASITRTLQGCSSASLQTALSTLRLSLRTSSLIQNCFLFRCCCCVVGIVV
jgi:hypothetical protein